MQKGIMSRSHSFFNCFTHDDTAQTMRNNVYGVTGRKALNEHLEGRAAVPGDKFAIVVGANSASIRPYCAIPIIVPMKSGKASFVTPPPKPLEHRLGIVRCSDNSHVEAMDENDVGVGRTFSRVRHESSAVAIRIGMVGDRPNADRGRA